MNPFAIAAATTAIVLADAAPPQRQADCPVAGNYRVAGTNPGGGTYDGTMTIRARDGECYLRWSKPNEAEGTGTYANGKLKVYARSAAGGEGTEITYTRQPNGVLKGVWHILEVNNEGNGTETLTPY